MSFRQDILSAELTNHSREMKATEQESKMGARRLGFFGASERLGIVSPRNRFFVKLIPIFLMIRLAQNAILHAQLGSIAACAFERNYCTRVHAKK